MPLVTALLGQISVLCPHEFPTFSILEDLGQFEFETWGETTDEYPF